MLLLQGWPMQAQDNNTHRLTWNDAPSTPRHRSEADWLVDVGWNTPDEVYGPFITHEYEVGEQEDFIPLGSYSDTPEPFVLRYRSDHAYFWFEPTTPVNEADIAEVAAFFENHIWPLNREIYGEEWNPGIDGDPRLHIVQQSYIAPGIMGAFNPDDQCPKFLCPQSNQREIIYISLEIAPLNSEEYLTTLAHEHQHLILAHIDGNEMRWFNEGLSQLAEHLNGFDPIYIGGENLRDFLRQPDLALNNWSFEISDMGRYYGAGYLFLVYLYERFGLDFIQQVVLCEYDGLAGVQHTLDEMNLGLTVDEVFRDWTLANYLDDPYVDEGHFYYQTLELPRRIQPDPLTTGTYNGAVSQYGADYLRLNDPGTYEISFDGNEDAALLDVSPDSGDWMWWSFNNSSSAARLSGAFDLTGLQTATLTFSAWWDTEPDFDWFQVMVSTDGTHWDIVSGAQATLRSAHSRAPGAYYSGHSTTWVDEQIDLSDYAGGPLLIRFEYLTDQADTGTGVAIDNLSIPELGYTDDVENPISPWMPEGFLRIPDTAPQNWAVTVVYDTPTPTVEVLSLDDLNTGRAAVVVPEGSTATLVVDAMAPFTDSQASYKITVALQ
jgi:hypothetical protein